MKTFAYWCFVGMVLGAGVMALALEVRANIQERYGEPEEVQDIGQSLPSSKQLAPNPVSGRVLTTDGTNNSWAVSSGGGGSGTNYWQYTASTDTLSPIAASTSPYARVTADSFSGTSTATSSSFILASTTALTAARAYITALANLTSNGFVKTGSGNGTLSIDTNTYLTAAITSLGGLTASTQTFATTSNNGGWGFSSSVSTHTLNIPTASAGNALGLLSASDYTNFFNKTASTSFSWTDTARIDGTYTSATGVFTADIVGDSIGDTQLAFNTGQNLTTTSGVTFATLTVTSGTSTTWFTTNASSTYSTSTFAHIKKLFDGTGSAGTNGSVLTSNGSTTAWAATNTLGLLGPSEVDTCTEFAAIMTGETGTCGGVVLSVGPTLTATTTVTNLLLTNGTSSGVFTINGLRDSANSLGTNGFVLQTNGSAATWVSTSSLNIAGGSASPGGTGTEVQYRAGASTFGAISPSAYTSANNWLGFGTTTPKYLLQLASSSAPQLTLSDGSATGAHFLLRASGNTLTIGTSTPTAFATTSTSNIVVVNQNGSACFGAGCTPMTLAGVYTRDQDGNGPTVFLGGNANGDTDWHLRRFSDNDSSNDDRISIGTSSAASNPSELLTVNWDGKIGIGTSSPLSMLSVQGATSSILTPIFTVASSSFNPYFQVLSSGTTTVIGPAAATSTDYCYSTAAGKGCERVMEDYDGAGCTGVVSLDGVLTARTVTCPAEI